MKKLSAAALVAAAAVAAAAATHLAQASPGHDPRDYAKGAASADPSAAPREPESDPKPAAGEPRPWAPVPVAAFPEGPSPAPTRQEWEAAPPARDVRVTDPGCAAQRIREWYRIGCRRGHWIELISGDRRDVSFECRKAPPQDDDVCDQSFVIFPARRGDRRAFQVFGWSKWGPSPDSIVTEQFLDGDPAPMVTAHGLRWGF